MIPRHIQLLWAAQGACGAATMMALAVGASTVDGKLDEALDHLTNTPAAVLVGARLGACGIPVPGIFCIGTRLVNWARRRAWEE